MATPRRLELLTSGVTGRRSNQLNYGAMWLHRMESNQLLKVYETCDLTSCPRCNIWWEELVATQPIWIFSPAHIRLCHLPVMVLLAGFEPTMQG